MFGLPQFKLVYSPQWFFGKDIIIDLFSFLVVFLIAIAALNFYRLNKKKRYLYLASSFAFLSLSFIFKIMTNFTIYYIDKITFLLPIGTYSFPAFKSSAILFEGGLLSYRLLTLFGLYFLYSIYLKNQDKSSIILFLFFIFSFTFVSHFAYYFFHLASILFLFMISYHFYKLYRTNKQKTTQMLYLSFGIIAASQILFAALEVSLALYVFGETFQLFGYVLLFFTYLSVLKHGKKKVQN